MTNKKIKIKTLPNLDRREWFELAVETSLQRVQNDDEWVRIIENGREWVRIGDEWVQIVKNRRRIARESATNGLGAKTTLQNH